jgi:hypothetical protein
MTLSTRSEPPGLRRRAGQASEQAHGAALQYTDLFRKTGPIERLPGKGSLVRVQFQSDRFTLRRQRPRQLNGGITTQRANLDYAARAGHPGE